MADGATPSRTKASSEKVVSVSGEEDEEALSEKPRSAPAPSPLWSKLKTSEKRSGARLPSSRVQEKEEEAEDESDGWPPRPKPRRNVGRLVDFFGFLKKRG